MRKVREAHLRQAAPVVTKLGREIDVEVADRKAVEWRRERALRNPVRVREVYETVDIEFVLIAPRFRAKLLNERFFLSGAEARVGGGWLGGNGFRRRSRSDGWLGLRCNRSGSGRRR